MIIESYSRTEFKFADKKINKCIDEIREQLVVDGGVIMGECLLNIIDDALYECFRYNKILTLPGDYFAVSWTAFNVIEADDRITITKD